MGRPLWGRRGLTGSSVPSHSMALGCGFSDMRASGYLPSGKQWIRSPNRQALTSRGENACSTRKDDGGLKVRTLWMSGLTLDPAGHRHGLEKLGSSAPIFRMVRITILLLEATILVVVSWLGFRLPATS